MSSSAIVGINFGVRYSYQITEHGLGLYSSLDFNHNGLNKEYKNLAKEIHSNIGHDLRELHSYFNIPVSLGINYKFLANDKISILCNSGVTLNFHKTSDYVSEYYTLEADWASSFGFKIGCGVLFKNRVSVQIDYY